VWFSTSILTATLIRPYCFNLWSQLVVMRIALQPLWELRETMEPLNSQRSGGLSPIAYIGQRLHHRAMVTPDDARIERLIEELYGRGYLRLGDFQPYIATRIAP
jgi:hypothetical protein